jgi:hypothetical protein
MTGGSDGDDLDRRHAFTTEFVTSVVTLTSPATKVCTLSPGR